MPKAKQSSRRKKFDFNKDRKKMKKKFLKKNAPRIENAQIRNAWDDKKSTARNLQEMGLAFDPNRVLPIKTPRLLGEAKEEAKAPVSVTTKPYVLKLLEDEAGRPEKDTKTLSSDLIEYVQYMVREHGTTTRRWPEMRRTTTRTHPNRSRGKSASTNAATRSTTTPSSAL
ncbi:hypothetical protein Q5P01_019071 [Channa striata]|uniref:Nucleolar protein 16 n=1 Tax=Channa striata TaxID=64152 RepID=A0AA88M0M2_CHASR|nr:hypothetical protein Q5P01_019071 [Channa striata]